MNCKVDTMRIGIIGGGLSGICLQRFLRQNSEVLEKEDSPGGLCRTFHKDGFSYDIGGHILFSKDKRIMKFIEVVLAKNITYCRRNNKVLFKGKYIKYPFENGLGMLEKDDIYDCLVGYLKNNYPKPKNFKEWIYYTFGSGIAEKYLIPYNRKIWKIPLQKLGVEWVERIPAPAVEDIIKSAIGIETEGYLHQLYFSYPLHGGIEALIKGLIKNGSSIITGFNVRKIQKKRNAWYVSDGKNKKQYDRLILTMPVDKAIKCLDRVPSKVIRAAGNLRHNTVRIILIGLKNRSLMDKSAIYLPEDSSLAHRVCFMGYFSKNMVPKDCSSLVAEISTHKGHALYNVSDSILVQMVIDSLCKTGLIKKNEITTTDIKNIEYAYVVHDLNHLKNMEILRKFFVSIGIKLLGRFGEFEYINMDAVIARSLNLAEQLNSNHRDA